MIYCNNKNKTRGKSKQLTRKASNESLKRISTFDDWRPIREDSSRSLRGCW